MFVKRLTDYGYTSTSVGGILIRRLTLKMKNKTYIGYGVMEALKTSRKYGLNADNSKLQVRNPGDLGSFWRITVKD